MRNRRRNRWEPTHFSNNDENLLFTKTIGAAWTARLLTQTLRLDQTTLAWIFWLVDDSFGDRKIILDLLLAEADQTRLHPEIRTAWDKPDDLASIVDLVIDRLHVGRLNNLSLELATHLSTWASMKPLYNSSPLARHLENTKSLFGLSQEEMDFAFLFSSMKWWDPIMSFFDSHLNIDRPTGRNTLMKALDLSPKNIADVLSGKLLKIGIFDNDLTYLSIDSEFLSYFVDPAQAPIAQDLFRQTTTPELPMVGLGLPDAEIDHLRGLFQSHHDSPLHVLIYGKPGTGKSTLSKALLSDLNISGFEVLGMNNTLRRNSRRAALAACLEMVSGQANSCLIVDEADQLLSTLVPWFSHGENLDKGWLNELLEKPDLRCIWICNSHENIDPAVLRRFAYSIEMKPLGYKKRETMLGGVLRKNGIKRHFTHEDIQRLSKEFELAPAVFETSASAAARIQGNSKQCRVAFRKSLVAKSQLLGQKVAKLRQGAGMVFLKNAINPSIAIEELESRVNSFDHRMLSGFLDQGSSMLGLLFSGQTGTGKTMTASYLAGFTGRPVLSFKASDWLDPYVGVTEQKISQAFQQAASDEAVMIVDEIDTFLGVRTSNSRRWETSTVNELLVQIENHHGIIICTTNRLEDIDPAAIRRFPLKVKFDFLKPKQILDTYNQVLSPLVRSQQTKSDLFRLENMAHVATADLFLVRNNILSYGDKNSISHSSMIDAIQQEVDVKNPSQGQVIGF